MSTTTKGQWKEIKGRCPACGHAGGFCTATGEGDDDGVLCRRNSAGRAIKQKDGGEAYLFRVRDLDGRQQFSTKPPKNDRKMTSAEAAALQKKLRTSISPDRLQRLAKRLGVSTRSLEAFEIGWSYDHNLYSFPMYNVDARGKVQMCGFRLRSEDGKTKIAITGSRQGIFIPQNFMDGATIPDCLDIANTTPLALLTPEGPTDCAAAFDLGFRAIGRPNNRAGGDQIANLLAVLPPQEMVIIGEWDGPKFNNGKADFPGISGALHVATMLCARRLQGPVRFMMPPRDKKDLRDWLPTATSVDIMNAISGSMIVSKRSLRGANARYLTKCQEAEKAVTAPQ